MKKVLVAALGLVLAGNAFGANWVEIAKTDKGDFYFDKESVQKKNYKYKPIVGFWAKQIKNKPDENYKANKQYVYEIKKHYFINCADRSITSESTEMLEYDAKGNILATNSQPLDGILFQNIAPDTVIDEMQSNVCFAAMLQDTIKWIENGQKDYEFQGIVREYPHQIKELKEYLKNNSH